MRPNWDEYFMKMVDLAATRSTCLKRKVGAVLVRDNKVLAIGYNGAPTGMRHCEETGCMHKIMIGSDNVIRSRQNLLLRRHFTDIMSPENQDAFGLLKKRNWRLK